MLRNEIAVLVLPGDWESEFFQFMSVAKEVGERFHTKRFPDAGPLYWHDYLGGALLKIEREPEDDRPSDTAIRIDVRKVWQDADDVRSLFS